MSIDSIDIQAEIEGKALQDFKLLKPKRPKRFYKVMRNAEEKTTWIKRNQWFEKQRDLRPKGFTKLPKVKIVIS